jgi:hypothetical protein
MSVFHEAFLSGRLTTSDLHPVAGSDGKQRNTGMARALKAVKRAEAEERNARTPLKRTAHWRRDREHRAARSREVESGD